MSNPLESQEQEAFFQWTHFYDELRWAHAIPNGGSRNKIEARNLKAQGVKSGIADIFIPVPRKGKHGLYIEMKRKKGGRISPSQAQFLHDMHEQGYATAVCYGCDEAIRVTKEYMGWTKKRN